jgi:hypothetical protein
MSAFDYPMTPLARIHGPQGYAAYESYRPWLRDEFCFRCVYCLSRERWGRETGEYALDHFTPQKASPHLALTYDNLVYACTRCNLTKSAQVVPDPATELTAGSVRVQPDGTLEGLSDDARSLILKLDLNNPQIVSWRILWIRIAELAAEHDEILLKRIMGFPDDIPDLSRLRPPGGNSRPEGVANSHFARLSGGELSDTY